MVDVRQGLTDPPEPSPPWLEPLARGDWDEFWPKFMPVPEADRHWIEQHNDPQDMAAAFTAARTEPTDIELHRVRAPALVYCGANDSPETVRATADALGVELSLIEGCDHLDAFFQVDRVLPLVLRYLDGVVA